jgi:DNA-binding CsgD family transcriptional regulator
MPGARATASHSFHFLGYSFASVERRVLKLIRQYKTSKEIAGELLISVRVSPRVLE